MQTQCTSSYSLRGVFANKGVVQKSADTFETWKNKFTMDKVTWIKHISLSNHRPGLMLDPLFF